MRNKNLVESFHKALVGFILSLKEQRNVQLIMAIAVVVSVLSLFLRLSIVEYMILSVTVTLVIVAELLNSAIEYTVDLVTEEFHPLARAAKDIAATAVMLASLNAIIITVLFIVDRLR